MRIIIIRLLCATRVEDAMEAMDAAIVELPKRNVLMVKFGQRTGGIRIIENIYILDRIVNFTLMAMDYICRIYREMNWPIT